LKTSARLLELSKKTSRWFGPSVVSKLRWPARVEEDRVLVLCKPEVAAFVRRVHLHSSKVDANFAFVPIRWGQILEMKQDFIPRLEEETLLRWDLAVSQNRHEPVTLYSPTWPYTGLNFDHALHLCLEMYQVPKSKDDNMLPRNVRQLRITNFYFTKKGHELVNLGLNASQGRLLFPALLRVLHIDWCCFSHTDTVSLTDLQLSRLTELEELRIGIFCSFRRSLRVWIQNLFHAPYDLVTNAFPPSLRSLELYGDPDVVLFQRGVFNNLTALEQLDLGESNTNFAMVDVPLSSVTKLFVGTRVTHVDASLFPRLEYIGHSKSRDSVQLLQDYAHNYVKYHPLSHGKRRRANICISTDLNLGVQEIIVARSHAPIRTASPTLCIQRPHKKRLRSTSLRKQN